VGEGSVFILTLPINKGMKRDFIKENIECNWIKKLKKYF
jgi:hypothetical protein